MKEKNKFYYLSSDTTFKYLFKNQKTRLFFEELIKYYTGLDISDFNFIDNELNSGGEYADYRLDSILTNSDKSIILNVEMNREYKEYTSLRNRRYLHSIAGVSTTSNYKDKRIVIQLNFNCYKYREDENICTSTYMLKDDENNLVIEDFKIHNVYIPKEEELCYNENIKKKLKLFLCNTYEEMMSVAGEDEELKYIVEEIEKLNKEKYFGALYNIEEEQKKLENSARIEGYEEGIEQGIKQGSLSTKEDIAKSLTEKGIDINIISEATGLSIEKIENLQLK